MAEQVRFSRASPVWPSKYGLRCKMQEKTTWQAARRPKSALWTRYRRWGHLEAVGKRLCVEWGSPSKSGFSRASTVSPSKSGLRCKMQEKTTWQASRRPKPAPWTRYRRWGHCKAARNAYPLNGVAEQVRFWANKSGLAEQVRFALPMQEKTTWQPSRHTKPTPWTRYRRWENR